MLCHFITFPMNPDSYLNVVNSFKEYKNIAPKSQRKQTIVPIKIYAIYRQKSLFVFIKNYPAAVII